MAAGGTSGEDPIADPPAPHGRRLHRFARLGDRLREHDWFSVAVELLIVVTGIFIGLQVDNWNRDRIDARDRRASLGRLHDESERAVAYFRDTVAEMERNNAARQIALAGLADGSLTGTVPAARSALGSVRLAPAAAPPRSAYDELVASGKFATVGDAGTREAITAYYASLDFLQGQTDYIRRLIVSRGTGDRFAGMHVVHAPGQTPPLRIDYDLGALSRDPDYLKFALDGQYLQLRQADWWKDTLRAAETMCRDIARLDQHPCRPPPPKSE